MSGYWLETRGLEAKEWWVVLVDYGVRMDVRGWGRSRQRFVVVALKLARGSS
jgi:hypothetical protein